MSQEKRVLKFPGQQMASKVSLKHVLEVFSDFSKGDVEVGARTVNQLNVAQMRNTRDIISRSLKSVGRKSEIFEVMTSPVDPMEYDQTVGMTQRSQDGSTFISTEVVTDMQGEKKLVSLAFTTKLREEVHTMLGKPKPIDAGINEDLAA